MFQQFVGELPVHLFRELRVCIQTFFRLEGVLVQPLHQGEVKAGALVEELWRMKVQVAEGRKDKSAILVPLRVCAHSFEDSLRCWVVDASEMVDDSGLIGTCSNSRRESLKV